MRPPKAAPLAPHPDRRTKRWDRILLEVPEDILLRTLGLLLFEGQGAPADDDGVRAPNPPLLPQSPAAAALGLPEHADLAKLRERAAVASRLAVVSKGWRSAMVRAGAFASLVLRHDRVARAFDTWNDAALVSLSATCRRGWFRDDGSGAFRRGVDETGRDFDAWLWESILPQACVSLRCCGCPSLQRLSFRRVVTLDLGFSDVDDEALGHVGLASRGSLRRLALPMCHHVGSIGAGRLAGAGFTHLERLDISGCRLSAGDVAVLVAALRSSLRSLDLSQCRPDDLPPRPLPVHLEESYSYGAAVAGDISDERLAHFARVCGGETASERRHRRASPVDPRRPDGDARRRDDGAAGDGAACARVRPLLCRGLREPRDDGCARFTYRAGK